MIKWAYISIIAGATLWGVIGIFVQALYSFGFSPVQVVAIRNICAGSILLAYTLLANRPALKIKAADSKYFFGTGILSIVFFNLCYFTTIKEVSVSVAAVLLYTSPVFVTIISAFVFKERLTGLKASAVVMTIAGCALVAGFLPSMQGSISRYGLITGLASGLGYALYSIFGKMAGFKYSSLTITTYTFVIAGAFMIPAGRLWEVTPLFANPAVWLYGAGLGVIPTILAYLLYTTGLARIEPSRASITGAIEPIVAMIVGVAIFGDLLSWWQMAGVTLIISAVFLVQKSK